MRETQLLRARSQVIIACSADGAIELEFLPHLDILFSMGSNKKMSVRSKKRKQQLHKARSNLFGHAGGIIGIFLFYLFIHLFLLEGDSL